MLQVGGKGPTYKPSSSPSSDDTPTENADLQDVTRGALGVVYAAFLSDLVGDEGCFKLRDPKSERAMQTIRRHLLSQHEDLWGASSRQ
ncbi:hypothetical protein AcW1_005355 [Taiwanofungus camphoratus]|nr:hypothetical protein AcW1_005355 [Antrodia cinnamomea]